MLRIEEIFQELNDRNKAAEAGGGEDKIVKQHNEGKKTARERINDLFDPGTFVELDKLVVHTCTDFGMSNKKIPGDGMVTGYGKIEGRQVFVFAQDFTVFGGSMSKANADKVVKVMQLAMKVGAPIVGLNDSGGARIQEGVQSLAGYADIFCLNVMASGVIPQISAILGPCAGGAVYSPALTDFILMVESNSYMFVTGPEVVKTVTHEDITKEELGGAYTHNSKSGVAHFMSENDESSMLLIRELLSYIPSNNMEDPPFKFTDDDVKREEISLQSLIPIDPNKPYNMKDLIIKVVDDGNFFEVQPYFAPNIIIGFARIGGFSIGIVANQPSILAGVLDINSSVKASRFVRFCDAFNIPLITLVDVPGFLPGTNQELGGIIRHGAKLLYAFTEATVPKITLITRKAYGGAYDVMSSKHIGADINYVYPSAEIAVIGPDGAAKILYKNVKTEEDRIKKTDEYRHTFANPFKAAELGYIDEIIDPKETRYKLFQALELTRNKKVVSPRRKHGNIPL